MARRVETREFVTRDQAEAAAKAVEKVTAVAALPTIGIHLTSAVPGLEAAPCGDEQRWKFVHGVEPSLILRRLLTRLGRPPSFVELRPRDGHLSPRSRRLTSGSLPGFVETDIIGEHPECPDDGYLTLATVVCGMSFDQAAEAHQSLIDAKWLPASFAKPLAGKAA